MTCKEEGKIQPLEKDENGKKKNQAGSKKNGAFLIICACIGFSTKVQFVGGQQQILGLKRDIGPRTEMVLQMVASLCALQTQLLGYSSSCGVANSNEFIHPRNDKWRVQAVAVSPDDHLSLIAGMFGCVFVHSSGFIGGNKAYDGALAMVKFNILAGYWV